jgi:nucleotide-binding universal stress UspA family protein
VYRSILVALDGSTSAERVLSDVTELARATGAEVIVVTVVPALEQLAANAAATLAAAPGALDIGAVVEDARRDADVYLVRIADRLRGAGVNVRHEILAGDVARSLADRARGGRADLIAMTTHGRSGVAHALFGSVAEATLRAAPCPVLIVPAR